MEEKRQKSNDWIGDHPFESLCIACVIFCAFCGFVAYISL